MDPKKEVVYLTHLTFHVRGFRPTINFSKVADKGILYLPFNPINKEVIKNESSNSDFEVSLNLPTDLQTKVDNGEVVLMIPKEGLPIFMGKDIHDYLERKRIIKEEFIHNHPHRTWHDIRPRKS